MVVISVFFIHRRHRVGYSRVSISREGETDEGKAVNTVGEEERVEKRKVDVDGGPAPVNPAAVGTSVSIHVHDEVGESLPENQSV